MLTDRALALAPDMPEAHVNLAEAYRASDRSALAERHLLIALPFLPGDAIIHHDLGELALQRGDRAAARAFFAEAVRLDPAWTEARESLAGVGE